jgi:hypothetical protein
VETIISHFPGGQILILHHHHHHQQQQQQQVIIALFQLLPSITQGMPLLLSSFSNTLEACCN